MSKVSLFDFKVLAWLIPITIGILLFFISPDDLSGKIVLYVTASSFLSVGGIGGSLHLYQNIKLLNSVEYSSHNLAIVIECNDKVSAREFAEEYVKTDPVIRLQILLCDAYRNSANLHETIVLYIKEPGSIEALKGHVRGLSSGRNCWIENIDTKESLADHEIAHCILGLTGFASYVGKQHELMRSVGVN